MQSKPRLYPKIESMVELLSQAVVSDTRKATLEPLINFIQAKFNAGYEIRLNFICTHNSRRSHLAQIWAQTLATYFSINKVQCYSGGTEATALYAIVAQTLQAQGFQVQQLSEGDNRVYAIKFAENGHPVIGFSKKMDDEFNPKSDFAAIMTCDAANEACPFVPGAEARIPITYEDPKAYDNTPLQAAKYEERSVQIATELFYVFSQIES